jgi:hypothetical protein
LVPFDVTADHSINWFDKWLLWGNDTPVRDFLTNDANLRAAQIGAGAVAVGAATVATGGAAAGLSTSLLAGGALSSGQVAVMSGVAGSVAGGATLSAGVAGLAAQAGAPITLADQARAAFDPQAVLTDAALGAEFELLSQAAPEIARVLSRLIADKRGSIDLGAFLAEEGSASFLSTPPANDVALPVETATSPLPTSPAVAGWEGLPIQKPTAIPPPTQTIFGLGSKIQGAGGEKFIAENLPDWIHLQGNAEGLDSALYGPGGSAEPAAAISQQKTIDTALKSYQGRGLLRLISRQASDVPWGGEYVYKGVSVEIGPQTELYLDVILPDRALTPAQLDALRDAVEAAASINVQVRIWLHP